MAKSLSQLTCFARTRAGLLLLSGVLALASIAGVMAQGLGPAGPSPATGTGAVIAQGVFDVPDQELVWQVSTYTAEAGSDPLEIASPTFILARTTPLLVTDETSQIRERIAPGEGVYLNPGQTVRLETFGPPDVFMIIELTPKGASTIGIEPLVGQPFRPLAGARDIDLVRNVVDEDETADLAPGAGRTLVLGLTGQVSASTGGESEVAISAGDIAEFEGPISFTGLTDGSEYVAAYIGSVIGFGDEEVAGTDATPEGESAATPDASPAAAPTEVPVTEEPTAEPTEVPATEEPVTEEPVTEEPTEAPVTEAPTEVPATEVPATEAPAEPAGTEVPAEDPGTPITATESAQTEAFELVVIEGDPGTDTDSDALTDAQEEVYETDPANADTDNDGINDYNEFVEYGTDPLKADTDDDGINDYNEIFEYETDPLNLDTDGDLLYDGGELVYSSDPLDPDTDSDALTDGEEVYFANTDPADADTDGDGINDYNEVVNGSDPLDPNSPVAGESQASRVDSDGDGLTDAQERRYGTHPDRGDSDGDGVNDSNEIDLGTDPLDSDSWPR